MAQLQMLWFDPATQPVKNVIPDGWAIRAYDPARADFDADGWLDACDELTGHGWNREKFVENMINDPNCAPDRIFFIYRVSDGRIGGSATARVPVDGSKIPSLHMVGVSHDFRGQGLSRPVCRAVMDWFRAHDYHAVSLLTDDFRVPAIKTYLTLGFGPWIYTPEMIGRWRGIFEKNGIKAGRWPVYDADYVPAALIR